MTFFFDMTALLIVETANGWRAPCPASRSPTAQRNLCQSTPMKDTSLSTCFAVALDGHTILAGDRRRYPLLAANAELADELPFDEP
jgi:hypothetical protein